MALRSRYQDYYYDLSRRETDHLEMPFWYVPLAPGRSVRTVFKELIARLPRILAGEQVTRPLIVDDALPPLEAQQPGIHRCGPSRQVPPACREVGIGPR